MTVLSDIHGTVATVLLCSLLFAEEAGVPIPFAPGELCLIAAGLLIATEGLAFVVFIPLACLACIAGALLGFSWARLVGELGLRKVAERLHATVSFDRVTMRLRLATALHIAASRLIPGLRIYTTLAAGAAGVNRRTFLAGMVPATVAWVVFFTTLGALVGLPAEHFLNRVAILAVRGGLLVLVGFLSYVAIRRVPGERRGNALVESQKLWRYPVALGIDVGVIACMVVGFGALIRPFFPHPELNSWVELVVTVGLVTVLYLVISRTQAGATAGEAVFNVSYRSRRAWDRKRA